MKVMVLIKANERSEAGEMPSERLVGEMMAFNERLVKAGVMLAGEGLHPSSRGARVEFKGNRKSVVDGPFAETKEQLGGYYLIECKDIDEATKWAAKCPSATIFDMRPPRPRIVPPVMFFSPCGNLSGHSA